MMVAVSVGIVLAHLRGIRVDRGNRYLVGYTLLRVGILNYLGGTGCGGGNELSVFTM